MMLITSTTKIMNFHEKKITRPCNRNFLRLYHMPIYHKQMIKLKLVNLLSSRLIRRRYILNRLYIGGNSSSLQIVSENVNKVYHYIHRWASSVFPAASAIKIIYFIGSARRTLKKLFLYQPKPPILHIFIAYADKTNHSCQNKLLESYNISALAVLIPT